MKKFYAILCVTIASLTQLQAQAPQGFNYQATVRNSTGDLIVNTNVYFKFNVMQGSQTSLPVFTEIHYVPTDDLGQVNLVIGQGTANTGAFSSIDWSLGSYYLGIELDTGNGYVAMGTTQLLSVPYALYAENSGNSTPTIPNLETVLGENNSANNQQIKDLQDPTDAQDGVTKAYVDTEVLNNVQNIEQVLTQGNDASGIQLKGIADPTDAQDAVTKAYFENNTTSSGLAPGNTLGDMLYWDGENWTQIPSPENNATLKFCDGQLTWGACKASIEIYQIGFEFGNILFRYSIIPNGSTIINGGGFFSTTNSNPSDTDNIFYFYDDYYLNELDESYNIENTTELTTYYIKVFVESNLGISYSDVIEFTTPSILDYDNDYDGYTQNQGDCDDNNYQVNPGASEIEDGIDNDCDGEIDEGFDIDGDGYSVDQGDCDDTNAQVSPNAVEVCDGIDNNCDGVIDEGLTSTFYQDLDSDGFGSSITFQSCTQPSGYVAQNGDCDDSNATINPNATEIEDGVDNDCDGLIDNGIITGSVNDIDGNTYDYITYGNQVWTVENADMVTYRDGTPIPQVTDITEWTNLTTGAWCYYDNDPTKPRLYNWYAVLGIHDNDPNTTKKEFAPEGWHVPTDEEWTTLENYLIDNGYNYDGTDTENRIAKSMASNTGWNSISNTGAIGNDLSLNNSSGFNAFPEGNRWSSGPFNYEGNATFFWSSTEDSTNGTLGRALTYNTSNLSMSYGGERGGFSVRFVRD